MGSGHNKIKKYLKYETSYIDKLSEKHHHEYNVKCYLKISSIHKNSIKYDTVNYYEVLKCQYCNSFISVSKPGNCHGHIYDMDDKKYQTLPHIEAVTNAQYLIYRFCDLKQIKFVDLDGK